MKKLPDRLPLFEDMLSEMANLRQKATGLPVNIWISSKEPSHGPRIKVQNNYLLNLQASNFFSVSISDEPKVVAGDIGNLSSKDLQSVYKWVILYKDDLLDVWNGTLYPTAFIKKLKTTK